MENEIAMQCVPTELMERLKKLSAKLWAENSPAAVHITALLEEFEPEIRSLRHIVKEFENVGSQRELRWKMESERLGAKLAAAEKDLAAAQRRIEELRSEALSREEVMSEMQVQQLQAKGEFSSKYASRMGELYEKINKKEQGVVAEWAEKYKVLEKKGEEMERQQAENSKRLEQREKALEEEFRSRKAELVKSFEELRVNLKAREMDLEADFNARKEDQMRTFERIKAALDAREKDLERKEKGGKDGTI